MSEVLGKFRVHCNLEAPWEMNPLSKTCEWRNFENGEEVPCGLPAHFHLTWPDGTTYAYCAKHFDIRVAYLRECGRFDVLEASGVKP
jgi:hypothetical protein